MAEPEEVSTEETAVEETAMEETPDIDYEAEAAKEGWMPKEDWIANGKPEHLWKDARTFHEDGIRFEPFIKAKNKRLEAEIERLKSTMGQHQQHYEAALERERREKEQAIGDLKRQRAEAINNGEGEKVNEIDERIEQLRQPESPQQQIPPEVQRATQEWESRNSWYRTDAAMQRYANFEMQSIVKEMAGTSIDMQLAELDRRVKDTFPHKFETRRPAGPESGRHGTPRKKSGGRTYEDLPSEAKRACDDFVRTIPGFTKEKYLETYDWSE